MRELVGRYLSTLPVNSTIRAIGSDYISTAQSTSSSSYTDLATVGPTVSLVTGSTVIVMIAGRGTDDLNDGANAFMSWAVSGATTVSASDTYSWYENQGLNDAFGTNIAIYTSLTPGFNTFTAKYKKSGGSSSTFDRRGMVVIAL
jgi:hypothetical protein